MRKKLLMLGLVIGASGFCSAKTWTSTITPENCREILSDFSETSAPVKWTDGDDTLPDWYYTDRVEWNIDYTWRSDSHAVSVDEKGLNIGMADGSGQGEAGASKIVLRTSGFTGIINKVTTCIESGRGDVFADCSVGYSDYGTVRTGSGYEASFEGYSCLGDLVISITVPDDTQWVAIKSITVDYEQSSQITGELEFPAVRFSDGQSVEWDMPVYVKAKTQMMFDMGNMYAALLESDRQGMIFNEVFPSMGGCLSHSIELTDPVDSERFKLTISDGVETKELEFTVTVTERPTPLVDIWVGCLEYDEFERFPNYNRPENANLKPIELPLGSVINFWSMSPEFVNISVSSSNNGSFSGDVEYVNSIELRTAGYDEIWLYPYPLPNGYNPDIDGDLYYLIKVNVVAQLPGPIMKVEGHSDNPDMILFEEGAEIVIRTYDVIEFYSENADYMNLYKGENCESGVHSADGEFFEWMPEEGVERSLHVIEAFRDTESVRVPFYLTVIDPNAEPAEPEFDFEADNGDRIAIKAGAGELHVVWRMYDAAGNEIANNLVAAPVRSRALDPEDESEYWLNKVDVDDEGYYYIDKPVSVGDKLVVRAKTVLNGVHSPEQLYAVDNQGNVTSVESVGFGNEDVTAEYFDLRGYKLNGKPCAPGIYIRRAGGIVEKINVR